MQKYGGDEKPDRFAGIKRNPVWFFFKWFIYSIIIFIYSMFMLRILSTCEGGETKILYITPPTRQAVNVLGNDFKIHTVKLRDIITPNGLFAASNAVYLEETGEFMVTVRYKKRNVLAEIEGTNRSLENPYTYFLSDENQNTYGAYHVEQSERFGYIYDRVCFSGISIDKDYHIDKVMYKDEDIAPKGITYLGIYVYPNEYNQSGADYFGTVSPLAGLTVYDQRTPLAASSIKKFKLVDIDKT